MASSWYFGLGDWMTAMNSECIVSASGQQFLANQESGEALAASISSIRRDPFLPTETCAKEANARLGICRMQKPPRSAPGGGWPNNPRLTL